MTLRPFIQKLAPVLTAYLLLVSVGLPLQRVYCACMGLEWLSLTTNTEHECHHPAQAVAHEHATKTCCHAPKKDAVQPEMERRHGCGDSELLLVQLQTEFSTEQSQWELTSPKAVQFLPAAPAEIVSWSSPVARLRALPIRGPTAPPLPAGRSLLEAHQSWLI